MVSRIATIRLVLWSLAVGAAAGMIGALIGSYSVVFRVMWTGFGAAIVAAFVKMMSRLVDREWTRLAGLFGMVAANVLFLLTLIAIWQVDQMFLEVGLIPKTAAWLGTLTLPTVGLLCLARTNGSMVAGWIGVILIGHVCLLGLVLIFMEPQWPLDRNLGMSMAWIAGSGCLVVGSLVESARYRTRWRWLGVVAAVMACVIGMVQIWGSYTFSYEMLLRNVVTNLIGVAIVVVFANIVLLIPLKQSQRWVRSATICAGIVTVVLIDLLVLYDVDDFDSVVSRLTGAVGIVTICGSLAILFLSILNRRMQLEPGSLVPVNVTMFCPGCNKKQKVAIGKSACVLCGLRIMLSVEEPRCPHCDYLLYERTGPACPECGGVIRSEHSPISGIDRPIV